MDLKQSILRFNLDSYEKIVSTHTSDVYKVKHKNKTFVLKILNDKGLECEGDSHHALSNFSGNGCVKLVNIIDNVLLLEYVDGEQLSSHVNNGLDKESSRIIAKTLSRLHSCKLLDNFQYPSLSDRFESLLKRGKEKNQNPLIYKSFEITEKLLKTERNKVLLHGDIHHFNIIRSTKRGWLTIDPQPLIGENLYDFANSFYNPDDCSATVENRDRVLEMAKIFSRETGADLKRILEFAVAHGGLSVSWQLDRGDDPARRVRILEMILGVLKNF